LIMCRKEISYLRMSQKEMEQLSAELKILSSLKHPNIVGYHEREHLKDTSDLHIYMEYCGGGDLNGRIERLKKDKQMANEEFIWSIVSQIITALYRCHYGVNPPDPGTVNMILSKTGHRKAPSGSFTILHRDLKPDNSTFITQQPH
jgi:NIMA (never in mitosis gene a)-related kinase 2